MRDGAMLLWSSYAFRKLLKSNNADTVPAKTSNLTHVKPDSYTAIPIAKSLLPKLASSR